jgi:excisionase family DNA binding protein
VRELPDVLTVEEAAALLRIGRTAAYQLTALYLSTEGREGMPVKRVGRQLRVPRARLEAWVGTPLHPVGADDATVEFDARGADPAPDVSSPSAPVRPSRARRRAPGDPTLPFTG